MPPLSTGKNYKKVQILETKQFTIIGLVVVSLLGWQVWSAVKNPLQAQLYQAYLQQVDVAMAAGDWSTARNWLADAKALKTTTNGAVSEKEQQIDRLTTDPSAERDFMVKNGNTDRSEVLNIVLDTYQTPKETLAAAGVLLSKRETRLAKIMIAQAAQQDQNYSGVRIMNDYAAQITN